MKNNNLKVMAKCSLMISISIVLSLFPIFKMPFGGSVTFASMAPIIMISFFWGIRWGCLSGFIWGLIQIIEGFHFPPAANITSLILVILLDYFLPFIFLGMANLFAFKIKNKRLHVILGSLISLILRLICSILSGIFIWKDYAPQNISVVKYSIIYNCTYMIPEIILTIIACLIINKYFNEKSDII